MESIAKYSVLNPFASCFVPASIKKFASNDTVSTLSITNYEENPPKVVNRESLNSVTKFASVICPTEISNFQKMSIPPSSPAEIDNHDLMRSTYKLLKENLYFTNNNINWDYISATSSILWQIPDVTAFMNLLLVALFSFYPEGKCSITSDVNAIEEINDLEDNSELEKCNCPPMFGCIIPLDFFGNPLNLNSSCNKKHVHARYYSKADENINVCNSNPPQKNFGNEFNNYKEEESLERRYCDMGELVYDVCKTVGISSENSDGNMASAKFPATSNGINDQIKMALSEDTENAYCKLNAMPMKSDIFNLDDMVIKMEVPEDSTIIDDGFHPLLDERISMGSDEGVTPVMEKMIEADFCQKSDQKFSFDPEEIREKSICNPPCSIWCDSKPLVSKDTYRKFINSLPVDKNLLNTPRSSPGLNRTFKPSYTRSFSSDSLIQHKQNLYNLKSNVRSESNEKMRIHNQAIDCRTFNQFMYNTNDDKCKSSEEVPLNVVKEKSAYLHKKDKKKGKWGPFDGVDSLWQPLPDCVQVVEHSTKQNANKRARELKRLKSLN